METFEDIQYIADEDTTCVICSAEFIDEEDLKIHTEQVHQNNSSLLPCQFCNENFRDIEEYSRHIVFSHISDLVCCQFCTRVFSDVDVHRKHEVKHRKVPNKTAFSCSQCTMVFKSVVKLVKHEYYAHTDSKDGVFLKDSLPHISSILNINALKYIQSFGTDRVYHCVNCHTKSLSPVTYIKHLVKSNCISYACNNCSYVSRKKLGVQKHFSTETECSYFSNNQTKKCLECHQEFPINIWHDHRKHCKAIRCNKCNIIFETMYDLSKHQTEKHPLAVSLQVCPYCKREFVGTISLEKHIERSHQKHVHLYKYICVKCKELFKHPKQLLAHFYSRHKDLKPYTCKICDETFRLRKHFTQHIKVSHEGEGIVKFDKNFHVYFTGKETTCKQKELDKNVESDDKPDNNSESNNIKKGTSQKPTEIISVNCDFLDLTETEGNQTEADQKRIKPRKRKLRPKIRKSTHKRLKRPRKSESEAATSSSDDEPLLEVKKRVQKKLKRKSVTFETKGPFQTKPNASRFKCNFCNKQCYTFQNYHHHINTQHQNERAKCIKCEKYFKSRQSLSEHIAKAHASSKLTETLKNLLQKRRTTEEPQMSNAEKFKKTIKKVCCDTTETPAKLTPCAKDGLSVQKFIESFTPETTEKEIIVQSNVTIKPVNGMSRPPLIKLSKFKPVPEDIYSVKHKLARPVRFKSELYPDEVNVRVKILQNVPPKLTFFEENRYNNTYPECQSYTAEHYSDEKDDIPDVAQEVMLEGTEEAPNPIRVPHKIVLPKLPKELNQMHIAHLLPEAPYFKIVKMKDVLENTTKEEEPETRVEEKDIKLPNGTKLVNVNPLAHLLKDIPVEQVLENYKPNKYCKTKPKNFELAVAKALMDIDRTPKRKRKTVRMSVNSN